MYILWKTFNKSETYGTSSRLLMKRGCRRSNISEDMNFRLAVSRCRSRFLKCKTSYKRRNYKNLVEKHVRHDSLADSIEYILPHNMTSNTVSNFTLKWQQKFKLSTQHRFPRCQCNPMVHVTSLDLTLLFLQTRRSSAIIVSIFVDTSDIGVSWPVWHC
jgi:hypothetical protein